MSIRATSIIATLLIVSITALGGILNVNATHEEFVGVPVPHQELEEAIPAQEESIEELVTAQEDLFDLFFSSQAAEDDAPPQCNWFKITEGCDFPSGLDILISIFIGVYLAIVIHMMARHQQQKLESNSEKIQKNTIRLEKIITSQENMRLRRRNFAIHSFKNHLENLLSTISSINESVTKFTEDKKSKSFLAGVQSSSIRTQIDSEEEIKQRLTQTMRNTIIYASDVLDPVLVSKIDELCSVVAQTYVVENDSGMTFPGFDEAKKLVTEASQIMGKIDEKITQLESESETED